MEQPVREPKFLLQWIRVIFCLIIRETYKITRGERIQGRDRVLHHLSHGIRPGQDSGGRMLQLSKYHVGALRERRVQVPDLCEGRKGLR